MDDKIYIYKNQEKLRCGYTTGSCAQAATKAAAIMLLGKCKIDNIEIITPKGICLKLKVYKIEIGHNYVKCAIKKDSGDDPDVTNGIYVYSKVSMGHNGKIEIDGGIGVGRVTKEGLQLKVGEAAINKVPKMMIYNEIKSICEDYEYNNGIMVEISIPEAVEIAKKTFNPRLGIEGGISILGTSGIIEPMSEKALIDSIRVEMRQLIHNGAKYLLITPGNYGAEFTKEKLKININNSLKCSNFIGETIDMAIELQAKGILFIAHIGKFVKVAGGIMNTHSKNADCRMEIITANAALAGANSETLEKIMKSLTTEAAIEVLIDNNIKEATMKLISEKIEFHINNRAKEKIEIGTIIFSNKYGILGETSKAKELIRRFI